jgi:hypothetical protein
MRRRTFVENKYAAMQSSRRRRGDAPQNAVTRRSHARIFVRAVEKKRQRA